jgi:Kef-type K+ transport system membrane component KefB
LMAVLFAVVPVLQKDGSVSAVLPEIAQSAGWFLLKLIGFGAGCFFFSRYVEKRLTTLFRKTSHPETTMLLVAGTGIVIAAVAGWLGFSLAIGALFAGLLFSRDPDAVKLDTSFESIYELFTPFFFVSIGIQMDPASLQQGALIGSVLLVPAVLFKILGAGVPALLNTGRAGALLIGLSMVPRAEIAMIIMQRGRQLGDWAVSSSLFSGIVLICAVTAIGTPWVLSGLLERFTQTDGR